MQYYVFRPYYADKVIESQSVFHIFILQQFRMHLWCLTQLSTIYRSVQFVS